MSIFLAYSIYSMTTEIKNEPELVQSDKGNTLENEKIVKTEKKTELPTKSSMEILSELFSTFDAEPPIIVKEEKIEEHTEKKHKKKKKHKHKAKKHKKKSKKRHFSTSSTSGEDGKVDLEQILIKQEKDTSAKKIKIEGTGLSLNLDNNKSNCEKKESDENDCKTPEGSPTHGSIKKNKIFIQDLKKSSLFDISKESLSEDDSNSYKKEKKHKKKHKQKSKKRSRSKSKERSHKKVKGTDLRDILKEKESKSNRHKYSDKSSTEDYDEKGKSKTKEKDRSKERSYDDKHLYNKYREEYHRVLDDYKRSRKDNPFYRTYKDELSHKSSERDHRRSSRDR